MPEPWLSFVSLDAKARRNRNQSRRRLCARMAKPSRRDGTVRCRVSCVGWTDCHHSSSPRKLGVPGEHHRPSYILCTTAVAQRRTRRLVMESSYRECIISDRTSCNLLRRSHSSRSKYRSVVCLTTYEN